MPIIVRSAECLIVAEASGTLQRDDVASLTAVIDGHIANHTRFLVLGDALAVTGVAPAARQFVGEHRKRHLGKVEHLDLGLVLAMRSPIVRGALTAISWFSGAFANLRLVDGRADVVRLSRAVLEEQSVPLGAAGQAELERFSRAP